MLRIRNWNELFETHESRKLKKLHWVPIPNKHDGLHFRALIEGQNALESYAVWLLLVQVASKCPKRGDLADGSGKGLTPKDIARKCGAPVSGLERGIKAILEQTDWLIEVPEIPADSPGPPADSPGPPACGPRYMEYRNTGREDPERSSPSEKVSREEELPPGKSLFGDFPAERQRPKADELPNEGGEGWQLWVKAWEGHPPNARHLEPAGVLSILERKAKDSAVRPKLAHAMTLFRRSQQVKNKTLENFINTHFNTYLGQAKPEAPAVDPNREQALNKAYQSLYIYTKRTDKTPLTCDAIQALRTKAEALRAAGREWPAGFKVPD